ncbi:UvrD-helicase domain-containing protein [Bradyrhizobium sp. WSM471]|uniref:UvrD-helicase domain-containing protein n=1 Tax=Bradyrhizobium sp. WSM471 TaxID=319017 RepID=UPI00024D3721|nr:MULTISPECIES: UvrD-helicase domain-containing protein [Bradyrhizobium]EHR05616.1 ATP-dependent exonuclase V beta subunit, helicase and exonuclease domain-containing [Bradyrhizobium sp. WSM471]UFW40711.1 UvrD-helicase domain-containing protein [Bradyrhizobium canariense]
MNALADSADRRRALTVLDQTLLVEAAAGTGKTSLLAGRVTMLLASGVAPRNIAAITFTELAAGELRVRVERFVNELLNGNVPDDLALAVDKALTAPQRAALIAARARLDELTATTIHGFCHKLLRSYAIEAGVDPGAEVLDAVQTEFAFTTVFERWLRRRLGENADPTDPVVVMARRDPREAVDTLKKLGKFRRDFRTAKPLPRDLAEHADLEFVESVREFRRWIDGTRAPDRALEDIADLERLAVFFTGAFNPAPSFERLWELAHPPRVEAMAWRSNDLRPYRRLGAWKYVAGKDQGTRLAEEAASYYDRCATEFRGLLGSIATALVATFSGALDELLEDFEAFKRNAAVLDFDDLLLATRALLRGHEAVRRASSKRYTRILVDEFQDTDPVQAEILFLIASAPGAAPAWQARILIPGSLFMVGDPKQAIYRFRGADVATYMEARNAVERQFPGNILRITTSFRSRGEILDHVNRCFRDPLGRQAPGYVPLVSSLGPAEHGLPCVMKATIRIGEKSRAAFVRDKEAHAVADICAQLIGNVRVRRSGGETSLIVPGDIALLAPVGTELWRYERALEERGLPLVSQAGRNLFRRQEAQDFVALIRTLADPGDTLALGALLRGPLVGLTDHELLDITRVLAPNETEDRAPAPRLALQTPPDQINHPLARETLSVLADLRRRVRRTTPFLLLSEAIDRLRVRATLAVRGSDQAARALANLDLLMERARRYGVRGLKQLAQDIDADWEGGPLGPEPYDEARLDADREAIEIITVHSAKGLEWPIVIPINMGSELRRREPFIHRHQDDTLHWVLGDVVPPAIADAIHLDDQDSAEEHERLLYVACTRAIEMLILPTLSVPRTNSWAHLLDLRQDDIPEWDPARFSRRPQARVAPEENHQSEEVFAAEQAAVADASRPIRWVRPSDGDTDRLVEVARVDESADINPAGLVTVAGSAIRGAVLHKLIEEILTGEIEEIASDLQARAADLLAQLAPLEAQPLPDPAEMAATALRTLRLPGVAEHRAALVPELALYAARDAGRVLTAGRADALAVAAGLAVVAFDWKSDVAPTAADRQTYARQLLQYLDAVGAPRGAVVYLTLGELDWIDR